MKTLSRRHGLVCKGNAFSPMLEKYLSLFITWIFFTLIRRLHLQRRCIHNGMVVEAAPKPHETNYLHIPHARERVRALQRQSHQQISTASTRSRACIVMLCQNMLFQNVYRRPQAAEFFVTRVAAV
ncbi:MAG: hypothetical protein K2L14_01415, partial [Duncaniella sp.]|nr:hypothetical protein [Duncaniella sp.]